MRHSVEVVINSGDRSNDGLSPRAVKPCATPTARHQHKNRRAIGKSVGLPHEATAVSDVGSGVCARRAAARAGPASGDSGAAPARDRRPGARARHRLSPRRPGASGRPDRRRLRPDKALLQKYAERYKLADAVLFTDLAAMLDRTKPEAVAAFTNTFDHAAVVEAAAPRRIDVMMEKPLAVSNAHAQRIRRAAGRGGIDVLVNYETTWYPSHGAIWALVKEKAPPAASGRWWRWTAIRGRRRSTSSRSSSSGCPTRSGTAAGALRFRLLRRESDDVADGRPAAHCRDGDDAAVPTRRVPPRGRRGDDSGRVYPKAQGIIQASWNWPFSRKDFEVYGEKGLAIATGGNGLRVALPKEPEHAVKPDSPCGRRA